eukprot:TRINITY_DN38672_c0_g1_i1.p1 TRINITY_DN38672_c0_g1~~TRINITY_DN38672_c0_g1_i1.p1  ORF type:complete len:329 (+),score=43.82 TRINITY_DN38672_c0_g1_i1:145-987(+)
MLVGSLCRQLSRPSQRVLDATLLTRPLNSSVALAATRWSSTSPVPFSERRFDFNLNERKSSPGKRLKARVQRGVTGRFSNEFWGGKKATEDNVRLPELDAEPYNGAPYSMDFRKYKGIAADLGAEYYFREGQKSQLTYYHMRCKAAGDMVMVGSTDERAREARTIDNYVKERTRGFAAQLVLEGRGVKAYFEPKFPHLKVRLGVGAKVTDLKEYCTRDPDCTVSVNKAGDVVVVHGPNKARVGTLAYRLLKRMQPVLMPYTGKGAHFAFHPAIRKAVRKK